MIGAALLALMFNLNTATAGQLQRIPGVGPDLARRIVEFRGKKGGFRRIEELLAIPGVSERKWQTLKLYVTLESPDPVSKD
jgi:competence protein ComEA